MPIDPDERDRALSSLGLSIDCKVCGGVHTLPNQVKECKRVVRRLVRAQKTREERGVCNACGSKLTRPESIARGVGPSCEDLLDNIRPELLEYLDL